ncbi:MAG: diaminopimelate epimerase [Mesorhizobium sp.]|uniref:diaminopimelate epimerase n=1 Tax=Mesorhizobium sp. TaxID=1871066 RepID=UPI000FE7123D|nr:MAG: diaminopimelate epimerase [Mesorhizobium sp.]
MTPSHTAFFREPWSFNPAFEIPFIKMHGLRNAFVILDGREHRRHLRSPDIERICDAHAGVGADELLVLEPPTKAGLAAGAAAFMRIFNIDGREVGACGNATRCVAYLLMNEAGVNEVLVETAAGVLACRDGGPMTVSVELGPISLDWRRVPLSRPADTLDLPLISGPLANGVAVNVGNPHAVFFVSSLAKTDLPTHAPAIQTHPLFAEGANVGAAEIVDENTIRLAVWERPGILTQACGTGACAAVFAAHQRKLVKGHKVTVHLPGGVMAVAVDGDMATMTGPVSFCCRGHISLSGGN